MLKYRLYKQRRAAGKNKGKDVWAARNAHAGKITSRALVDRLSQGTTVDKPDALAVLGHLSQVLPELMRFGESVQIDGVGTFRLVLRSSEVERAEDFDVRLHMKKPNIVFRPADEFVFACTQDLHYQKA